MFIPLASIRAQFVSVSSLLRIQWNPAQIGLRGLREDLTALAHLMAQEQIRHLLIDMNELPSLGLDEQFWLATSWVPRISSQVLEQVALVLPAANVYNQLAAESVIRAGRPFINFDIHFFSSPVDALDWLVGDNPALLHSLAEEWAGTRALLPAV